MDGILDEPGWALAEPATGFVQREPREGAAATESTEVRVLLDRDTLYIGIVAADREPGSLIARHMRRDGALPDDDGIEILLDTFHDHRSAFLFGTNPNGILVDAMITDEGRGLNFDWDGIWEVEARTGAGGWSAEMAIPVSTLRFATGADTWGLNVRRFIRRKEEVVHWAPIGRDADVFRVSRYGHLHGMSGLRHGSPLRVKPFALGSLGDDTALGGQTDGKLGADLRWASGSGLVVDLTANTDFAQVEADELRVNLTRFPLFFPEKREFFLENAGLFEFGDVRPGEFGPPVFRAFFSRRIGIDGQGRAVPITAGARLTGRTGGWSFGLLDVQTRAPGDLSDGETVPADNWAVARVERALGERSAVGMILTNRQQAGGRSNRLLGFDVDASPLRQLNVRGFWARSWSPGQPDGNGSAAGAGLDWRASTWGATFDFLEIGDTFQPEAGFLLRRGVRRYFPGVWFEPRSGWSGIRNLYFGARADVFTRTDGTLESASVVFNAPGFQLDSGDYVESFFSYNFERLFQPFPIRPDVVIPPGEYSAWDGGIFATSDPSRPLSVSGVLAWGEFYDGTHARVFANVGFRLGRHWALRSQINHDRVRLSAGDFDATILRQRLDLTVSPRMFVESLVQYDLTDDLLSAFVRYRWTYRPGADLFLVLDSAHTGAGPDTMARAERTAWALILKTTFLWIP